MHALDAELVANRDPARQLSLWQQRVQLMRNVAAVETSRHYLAAQGRQFRCRPGVGLLTTLASEGVAHEDPIDCLLIAAALSAGAAQAGEPTKPPAADKPQTAEQKAAQAEIDKLVERIKVLSTQLGEGYDVRVIVRKGKHVGPGDHELMMIEDGHGDGQRRVRIERIGPDGEPGQMHWKQEGKGEHDVVIKRVGGPATFRRGPGLGIVMAPNPAAAGVRIAAVSPESPAQKAGLRADDVLLSIDGKTISGSGAAAVETAREMLGKPQAGPGRETALRAPGQDPRSQRESR